MNKTPDTFDTFSSLEYSSCPEGLSDSASGGELVELADTPLSPQVAFPGLVDYRVGLTNLVTMEGPVDGLTSAPAASESVEKLSNVEKACLEAMKEDFYRGIVLIDPADEHWNALVMNQQVYENVYERAYQAALERDKTAGQSWEAIQERLLANGAALLKKAVKLSELTDDKSGKGVVFIGVFQNGDLAIRQKNSDIVNVIIKEDEISGKLVPSSRSMREEKMLWANAFEIIHAVKVAGYKLTAGNSQQLVAAFEVLTQQWYLKSADYGWRDAILELPHTDSGKSPLALRFYPPDTIFPGLRFRTDIDVKGRTPDLGAILWVIG